MTTQLYTASRLRVIRQCLRMHYYRYDLGISTPETDKMRFGTVGHAALEAYYSAWMDVCATCDGSGEQPFADTCDGPAPSCSQCGGIGESASLDDRLPAALSVIAAADVSPWDRIKLRILVIAYHERWGGCDWEILAVEQEFRYQLGDRLIGGKIDALIRDRKDGRVYVVEHKTTGIEASLGSAYWERLTIDTQVSIYIDGAGMLGHGVSGCIYDVIKRPEHEPKLATPIENREYTKGKGCKGCGGSGGGKAGIVQGRGVYMVAGPGESPAEIPCEKCCGTGWLNDAEGNPQAPRLHANQRDTDETEEAFEDRVLEVIAERVDDFLMRGIVVRLDDELPGMRQDLLDDIAIAETGLAPRNPDACAKFGAMCAFFDACSGRTSIDDNERFPRGRAHPELEAAI